MGQPIMRQFLEEGWKRFKNSYEGKKSDLEVVGLFLQQTVDEALALTNRVMQAELKQIVKGGH